MQSYRLRHRIEFQTPTATQNSTTGEMINSYATLAVDGVDYDAVPAEVLTGAGRNQVASGAEQHSYDCRINLRWFDISLPDLLQCRIIWDSRIYEIVSAEQDITARREWRLFCKGGIEVYQNAEGIANYPFTSNLLDLVNGYSLGYAVEPTPSAEGIPLVAATHAEVVTTGWPANDYVLSFTASIQNIGATGYMLASTETSPANYLWIFWSAGRFRVTVYRGSYLFGVTDTNIADPTTADSFNFTLTQSSTDGLSLLVEENGGSFSATYSSSSSVAQDDTDWDSYCTLGEDTSQGNQCDMTIKNLKIIPL